MRCWVLLLLAGLFAGFQPLVAQTALQGRVTDATTGQPLPAATVQLEGTFTGTITNRDGRYDLRVPPGASVVLVRFLGYQTARQPLPASGQLDVALTPEAVSLDEVVVSGEDPAVRLMRRVLERKARMREALRSWRADAYTRQVIRRDTTIVAILESVTEAWWDRERGMREVVKGYRRTENLSDLQPQGFTAADEVLNFYDDDVPFSGYRLMGPTHPDALDFYRFRITGQRSQDGQRIYDVAFEPGSRLQPGYTGTLAIRDADAVLLAVAVTPSASVYLPLVQAFEVEMRQQFSSFGQEGIALPVDFALDAYARIGMTGLSVPPIGFRIVSRLTDYALNVAVPDSLYASRRTAQVDSVAIQTQQALDAPGVTVPLDTLEALAYADIDSTDALNEVFQPTGPLARLLRISFFGSRTPGGARRSAVSFSARPAAWLNRVEGFHLGGGATVGRGPGTLAGDIAYQTALRGWDWQAGLSVQQRLLGTARRPHLELRAEARVYDGVAAHTTTGRYGPLLNSAAIALFNEDYFDYHQRSGGTGVLAFRAARLRTTATLTGRFEAQRSLDVAPRRNGPIADGRLHALGLRLVHGEDPDGGPFGGGNGVAVRAEHSGPYGGDFAYARFEAQAALRFPTFYPRRLFPNALSLRLAGGTHTGTLPVQQALVVDGSLRGYSPYGVLRSRLGRPYLAHHYAMGAAEHTFGSVPLEALGWRWAGRQNLAVLVHAAAAHTWAPDALTTDDGWHTEVGFGVSGGFAVPVRLDVTYRLDQPGVYVGLGVARFF